MTPITAIGKYLDQPLLTAKISKHVPTLLGVGGAGVLAHEVHHAPENKKFKTGIKTAIILAATGVSAVYAPKIAAKITKRELAKPISEIQTNNTQIIDEYLSKTKVNNEILEILEKAKTKVLSLKEVNKLNTKENKSFIDKLIPPPENIQAKDIFKEIGWLSVYGAVPVAGGIAGGVVADSLTEKNWRQRIPNKINEGLYQYLANIFLCNIGAGAALAILEKKNITSKAARCAGMVGGIILTGVIGGSAIANFIGKKIINPIMCKEKTQATRRPELLDIGLHVDDIATVSLLSGLKWIEPALPLLYSISGYRAGIGYRNHHNHSHHEKQAHFLRQEC